jgi:hypothetical protein
MDNLSAGTVASFSFEKEGDVPATAQRRYRSRLSDSGLSSTDSCRSQKLDGFPLESLDPFRWNHWMTSIGISGCFRLEWVDGLPRNTHTCAAIRTHRQSRSPAT